MPVCIAPHAPILDLALTTIEHGTTIMTAEKGENATDGILREVKEELGLTGELVRFIGVYDFKRMNQIILVWHVRARGAITIAPHEIAAYKLVPIHKLRPWPQGTGAAGTSVDDAIAACCRAIRLTFRSLLLLCCCTL
jgi:ADP-ribose pyrophosphatase YjhB (NUDIX family)